MAFILKMSCFNCKSLGIFLREVLEAVSFIVNNWGKVELFVMVLTVNNKISPVSY